MEFHQLQGRFDLAPVDPQTQRRTFPFERNDDLKSLATKYELMNPEKQAAHAKKAKKLRQKVQRFKTTKTEVLKVLTENGDIQPNISRYSGPGDTAIYEPMGRRPDMPIALDGKEKAVFQSLKSEFDETTERCRTYGIAWPNWQGENIDCDLKKSRPQSHRLNVRPQGKWGCRRLPQFLDTSVFLYYPTMGRLLN